MRKLATVLKEKYVNVRGFHTDRRIVVIESDDWGSIRTPSIDVLRELEKKESISDAFLKYDSLERYEDIERIIYNLSTIKDKNGKSPCITANFAVANPDFDRIDIKKESYHYEEFTATYARYGEIKDTVKLIREGIEKGFFAPQLHSLEHLNVVRWLAALKKGAKDAKLAFEHHMIGTQSSFFEENIFGYMDALNYDEEKELLQLEKRLNDAFSIFRKNFGKESLTFVAPCHVWSDEVELILRKNNVKMIQSAEWQNDFSKVPGTSRTRRKLHYTGEKNSKTGMYYSVRNCSFEPSISGNLNASVDACIRSIKRSFEHKKPAIINSHRVNYMGRMDEQNAINGINGLCTILKNVVQEFKDIEFMSSEELCDFMVGGSKK